MAPEPVAKVGLHDPATVLATFWTAQADPGDGGDAPSILECLLKDVAPFGRDWPGLAAPGEPMDDPAAVADRYAAHLHDGNAHLGLVAADLARMRSPPPAGPARATTATSRRWRRSCGAGRTALESGLFKWASTPWI